LYIFAGEMVYVVWRDSQGLQQRLGKGNKGLFEILRIGQ